MNLLSEEAVDSRDIWVILFREKAQTSYQITYLEAETGRSLNDPPVDHVIPNSGLQLCVKVYVLSKIKLFRDVL